MFQCINFYSALINISESLFSLIGRILVTWGVLTFAIKIGSVCERANKLTLD